MALMDVEAELEKLLGEDVVLGSNLCEPIPAWQPEMEEDPLASLMSFSTSKVCESVSSSGASSPSTVLDVSSRPAKKKRSAPESSSLPPDEERKRKNRESAQQSRNRKMQYVQTLEADKETLAKENKTLKQDQDVLRTENSMLRQQLEFLKSLFASTKEGFPATFYPGQQQLEDMPRAKSMTVLAVVFSVSMFLVPSDWNVATDEGMPPARTGGRMLLSLDENEGALSLGQVLTPRVVVLGFFLLGVLLYLVPRAWASLANNKNKKKA
eukprot:CAMPEP_0114541026 /NCGR_PEP_ID=MMETSP0114-20121206/1084_1 /TAXON_ID=31324 /ORGANISM="Goniomonas sp, Strain m" /LENGTH=267 /DNA_ID=CAMNT_0001725233 /DNA_START=40 /DNA_END=843 /DNA_ORIENTATION=-